MERRMETQSNCRRWRWEWEGGCPWGSKREGKHYREGRVGRGENKFLHWWPF